MLTLALERQRSNVLGILRRFLGRRLAIDKRTWARQVDQGKSTLKSNFRTLESGLLTSRSSRQQGISGHDLRVEPACDSRSQLPSPKTSKMSKQRSQSEQRPVKINASAPLKSPKAQTFTYGRKLNSSSIDLRMERLSSAKVGSAPVSEEVTSTEFVTEDTPETDRAAAILTLRELEVDTPLKVQVSPLRKIFASVVELDASTHLETPEAQAFPHGRSTGKMRRSQATANSNVINATLISSSHNNKTVLHRLRQHRALCQNHAASVSQQVSNSGPRLCYLD